MVLLHTRPWIWPWIKSISNELEFTIHVIASQLSRYCDVISNRLLRHQQKKDHVSETRRQCVKLIVFIVIYIFVMSCKKYNNVCSLMTNCFCAHSSVIIVCSFPSLLRNWEINTGITLPWALKLFVTRVHTLFSIYVTSRGNGELKNVMVTYTRIHFEYVIEMSENGLNIRLYYYIYATTS